MNMPVMLLCYFGVSIATEYRDMTPSAEDEDSTLYYLTAEPESRDNYNKNIAELMPGASATKYRALYIWDILDYPFPAQPKFLISFKVLVQAEHETLLNLFLEDYPQAQLKVFPGALETPDSAYKQLKEDYPDVSAKIQRLTVDAMVSGA